MNTEAKKNPSVKSQYLKVYSILVISAFFLLFLSFFLCQLDEVVISEGILRPSEDASNIKTLFEGTVIRVYYKNGQYVKKGDILFELDCSYEEEELKNSVKLETIYKTKINLLDELQSLILRTNIDRCPYEEICIIENLEYSSFVSQFKSYQNELDGKRIYYQRQKELFPIEISKQELENIENDYLQTKLAFINWIESKKIEILEKHSDYTQQLKMIELEIIKFQKAIENAFVRANRNGFINEIHKVNTGDYLNLDTCVLSIIPESSEMKAIINISNSNISKIQKNQTVLFQIKDLPYTKYGKLEGKITFIPVDAVISDTPYYPVEVSLNKTSLAYRKEIINLKVGTKISAKVLVDTNTIAQRALQKLVVYVK